MGSPYMEAVAGVVVEILSHFLRLGHSPLPSAGRSASATSFSNTMWRRFLPIGAISVFFQPSFSHAFMIFFVLSSIPSASGPTSIKRRCVVMTQSSKRKNLSLRFRWRADALFICSQSLMGARTNDFHVIEVKDAAFLAQWVQWGSVALLRLRAPKASAS